MFLNIKQIILFNNIRPGEMPALSGFRFGVGPFGFGRPVWGKAPFIGRLAAFSSTTKL